MFRKIISTLFNKGFIALINLAVLLVSSKQLGGAVSGEIGLLILDIAIIQIVNEIFTGPALIYFVPRFSLKKIYTTGITWTIFCISITTLLLWLIYWLNGNEHGQWMHLIMLSAIIIIHSFHGFIILAKQSIRIYNFLNFFQPFILLVVLLFEIFYVGERTAKSYIVALYVSFMVSLVLSSVQIYYLLTKGPALQEFNLKSILKNGVYNQLANLSHTLSSRFNLYILTNMVLVGIYARSSSLIEQSVLMISSSASQIVVTFIANSVNQNTNTRITFLLAKLCFLFSSLCVLVLYFLPVSLFTFLLGNDFASAKSTMLYLSPGVLCISFSTVISHYFAGLGKQKIILLANASGLLITVCLSKLFISQYGLAGACVVTSISYFIASLILVIVFMHRNNFQALSIFWIREDFKAFKKFDY